MYDSPPFLHTLLPKDLETSDITDSLSSTQAVPLVGGQGPGPSWGPSLSDESGSGHTRVPVVSCRLDTLCPPLGLPFSSCDFSSLYYVPPNPEDFDGSLPGALSLPFVPGLPNRTPFRVHYFCTLFRLSLLISVILLNSAFQSFFFSPVK